MRESTQAKRAFENKGSGREGSRVERMVVVRGGGWAEGCNMPPVGKATGPLTSQATEALSK